MINKLKCQAFAVALIVTALISNDRCYSSQSLDKDLIKVMNPLREEEAKEEKEFIAMPMDEQVVTFKQQTQESIPTRYMYTQEMLSSKYPSTKNQGEFGTCWAFSSTCMAEFDMINNSGLTKSIDYSELQLAYFTYHTVVDPLGGTKGDKNSWSFYDNYFTMGGNYYVAMRTYAKGIGAINESVVPYTNLNTVLNKGLDKKYAYNYRVADLKNAYLMSTQNQTKDIKAAVMERGAVGISYASADDVGYCQITSPYGEDRRISTHYCKEKRPADHAVAIVGWDDNFSKENFDLIPPGNGAWLVRNSWSDDPQSESGMAYFWLSYYDKTISSVAYSFDFDRSGSYSNNYQYDGGYLAGRTNAKTVANVFKTKDSAHGETLKSVMLSFTEEENVGYTIEVYTQLKKAASNPTAGKLVSKTTGRTSYAGMYTIDLSKPVMLGASEYFAIVVRLDKKCMDSEYSYNVDKENTGLSTSVTSAKGQSFTYSDGKWKEKKKGNYCIKAFTINNDSSVHSVKYVLKGGTNSYKNPHYFKAGNNKVKLYSPKMKNAYFIGWYSDSKYKHKVTAIPANRTRYIRLYAKWMKKNPPKIKYVRKSGKALKISWKKVGGASDYYIYRKQPGGKWKLVKKTKKLWWKDNKVQKNKTYCYRIRAHCSKGKGSYSKTVVHKK